MSLCKPTTSLEVQTKCKIKYKIAKFINNTWFDWNCTENKGRVFLELENYWRSRSYVYKTSRRSKALNYECHIITKKSVFIHRSHTKRDIGKPYQKNRNKIRTLLLLLCLNIFACALHMHSGTMTRFSSLNCIITLTWSLPQFNINNC